MAEIEAKRIITGTVIVILFAFLIINFAISVGNEYDMDTSELSSGQFNLTGMNDTLSDVQSQAEDWKESFADQNVFIQAGLVLTGIFQIALSMWDVVTTPFTLILGIMNDVLMFPPIVTGVIIFVFIVAMIIAIWRLIRE